MVSASNILAYLYISFSPRVPIFSGFGSSIPSVMCRLPLVIFSMAHFSMPNFAPVSFLFILTVCIRFPILFRFWQRFWCRPCTLGDRSFLAIFQFVSTSAFPENVIEWHWLAVVPFFILVTKFQIICLCYTKKWTICLKLKLSPFIVRRGLFYTLVQLKNQKICH